MKGASGVSSAMSFGVYMFTYPNMSSRWLCISASRATFSCSSAVRRLGFDAADESPGSVLGACDVRGVPPKPVWPLDCFSFFRTADFDLSPPPADLAVEGETPALPADGLLRIDARPEEPSPPLAVGELFLSGRSSALLAACFELPGLPSSSALLPLSPAAAAAASLFRLLAAGDIVLSIVGALRALQEGLARLEPICALVKMRIAGLLPLARRRGDSLARASSLPRLDR
jgi:hypothetical protein